MACQDHVIGSGNVFQDRGLTRPAEALAKTELARKNAELIAERRLTPAATEALLDVINPSECVHALTHGRAASRRSPRGGPAPRG